MPPPPLSAAALGSRARGGEARGGDAAAHAVAAAKAILAEREKKRGVAVLLASQS
jgi:hypothetical protein